MQLNLEFIRLQNGQILKFKAMTKEEKRLLLQDLSARLPYGVICHYNCVAEYDTMVLQKANCVNKLEGIIPFNGQIGYMVGGDKVNALSGDIKPYLRPMSSMTKDEYEEETTLFGWNTGLEHYDWLNAHHFDYRGLIEKGLAIEAPEGMYKIN